MLGNYHAIDSQPLVIGFGVQIKLYAFSGDKSELLFSNQGYFHQSTPSKVI